MPILHADYSSLNHEAKAEAIGIKPEYIPIIIKSFFQESIEILDKLQKSIESKEYESIRAYAHAIKGSAGNIDFKEIYEMAKEMEEAAAKSSEEFDYMLYCTAVKKAVLTISH